MAGSFGPTAPNAACAGVLYTGAMSDAVKIMNAMILARSDARGAHSVQDMMDLTLLATRLSLQDSATGGVPVLAWVTQAATRVGGALVAPARFTVSRAARAQRSAQRSGSAP